MLVSIYSSSWGFGNNGCDGGEDFRAYQVIFLIAFFFTNLIILILIFLSGCWPMVGFQQKTLTGLTSVKMGIAGQTRLLLDSKSKEDWLSMGDNIHLHVSTVNLAAQYYFKGQ